MKPLYVVVVLAALAGCGADGVPEAPASKASTTTGLTISGCASVGVSVGAPSAGGKSSC
ncbi:argininosuccinate lyase [Tabrizicola sp.]|uniref:argininosuccinate lyase n=1 Tax=Tabrizicola sp. TaxID=2005166 RepID=UPI003D292090